MEIAWSMPPPSTPTNRSANRAISARADGVIWKDWAVAVAVAAAQTSAELEDRPEP